MECVLSVQFTARQVCVTALGVVGEQRGGGRACVHDCACARARETLEV